MVQNHSLAGLDVGGHRGERSRQAREVLDGGDRETPAAEQEPHVLTCDQPAGERQPVGRDPDLELDGIAAFLRPAVKRERGPGRRVGEEPLPVDPGDQGAEAVAGEPRCVQPAHDRAHARSRDHVHRNPQLLEDLENPHVSEPTRSASGQDHADRRPISRFLRGHGEGQERDCDGRREKGNRPAWTHCADQAASAEAERSGRTPARRRNSSCRSSAASGVGPRQAIPTLPKGRAPTE